MKIKELWVSEYKNIKDLTLNFESDLITLLVGRNGMGKSNLIEILALIFRDLDLLEKEEDFKNWPFETGHFEYIIRYECKDSEVTILCHESMFSVLRKQKGSDTKSEELKFSEFRKRKKQEFLPDYIIGYYSGENKRIREIIRPYEEIIWKNLKNNKELEKGFRPMFFSENYHSQLVLLTVLLYRFYPPSEEFQKRIDYLIKEFTSFASLEKFTIHLKQPEWYNRASEKQRVRSIEKIVENLLPKKSKEEDVENPFWDARGKAGKVISFFYNNSPDEPVAYYDENDGLEHLIIDLDKKKVATKVKKEFGHPANFLDAFDSLYVIDSIYEIVLNVRSQLRDTNFNFKSLSEGEQQLITVLGLILITGRQDCLFLLDEPDTHLNPRWQRRYVELLNHFNLNDYNSHIIVATHSPLLVQAAENADIFIFKEREDASVEVNCEDFKIQNWRIDQVFASEYFNFENTRNPQIDGFMKERENLLSKVELTSEDLAKLKAIEEEHGVLPSGETLNDFKAIQLIRSIINQSQKR